MLLNTKNPNLAPENMKKIFIFKLEYLGMIMIGKDKKIISQFSIFNFVGLEKTVTEMSNDEKLPYLDEITKRRFKQVGNKNMGLCPYLLGLPPLPPVCMT